MKHVGDMWWVNDSWWLFSVKHLYKSIIFTYFCNTPGIISFLNIAELCCFWYTAWSWIVLIGSTREGEVKLLITKFSIIIIDVNPVEMYSTRTGWWSKPITCCTYSHASITPVYLGSIMSVTKNIFPWSGIFLATV